MLEILCCDKQRKCHDNGGNQDYDTATVCTTQVQPVTGENSGFRLSLNRLLSD